MSNRDLLFALADELEQGEALIKQPLELLTEPNIPQECIAVSKEDYCDFTTRVAGVAEAINLGSLQALMAFVDTNVSMIADAPVEQRSDEQISRLLQSWPGKLAEFIRHSDNLEIEQQLRQFLHDNRWPWQVDATQFETMLDDIRSFGGSEEKTSLHDDEEEFVPSEAEVSLTIPDDVSPKLLLTFQQELPQSTAELSQCIQRLFDTDATLDDISDARRVAHTLKGAANIVGVVGIANVTHFLEDILEFLINKPALPGKVLADSLTEAVDCLEIMSEATLGISEPPPQSLQVLEMLLDWRNKCLTEEVDGLRLLTVPSQADVEQQTTEAKSNSAVEKVTPAKQNVEPIAALAVNSNVMDKLLDLSGELSSSNLLTQGQLQSVVENYEALHRYQVRLRSSMGMLQEMIFSQGLKKTFVAANRFNINAGDHKFDPLEMDQYNEIHSIASLMMELMDDVADVSQTITEELNEIKELLNQQDQLNKELDQSITAERLMSVKTILPRLQRSVRQTCRMVEKNAELVVYGDSLEVDNSILDAIVDPLLHMLRNAVDHGVETPSQRAAALKPELAIIELRFERQGNNIVITCRDDGSGINISEVKRKALEMGLIHPEEIITENSLFELILQPGFSTKKDASQVSGRGVGMDVVAKNISDLRGSISIKSEQDNGTEFTITVPQTLLKTHVMLLRSEHLLFGVLSGSFNQIVSISSDLFFADDDGDEYIGFGDRVYEVRHLAELLGVKKSSSRKSKQRQVAILVEDAERLHAALIDEAIGSGELVIKKIGEYVPKISGIIGTVLTENGMAAPVFDLKELLRKPSQLIAEYLQKQIEQPHISAIDVLIVDDSNSARRSMTQVAKDAGYDVRTAIDGMEAISLIEEKRPDLLLTDLEMPKMNGLELAAHLRSMDVTKDLPIVMVTSRSTEKHRAQAMSTGIDRYITKPYTNDDLVYEMHQLLDR